MIDFDDLSKVSFCIKMMYPDHTTGKICDILKVNPKDRNQRCKVDYGVWRANNKLGLRGGYTTSV